MSTTVSVKVSKEFAQRYRGFCEANCLQIGKFTEQALIEVMEDYHFGLKAQRVLTQSSDAPREHKDVFKDKV